MWRTSMTKFRLVASALWPLFLASGCVHRTYYAPHSESGGYSEKDLGDGTTIARFSANALTHPDDARLLSLFRALEICKSRGKRIARFWATDDKSSSTTVRQTSTQVYQSPTYFSGSKNYGNSFSGSAYGGNQYGTSLSWDEKLDFPMFDTLFSCGDTAYMTRVTLRVVSDQDMKPYVKDLMGALQIEKIAPDSPNKNVLYLGDIITKVNGLRVRTVPEMSAAIDSTSDKANIKITLIREGKELVVNAQAIDSTQELIAENQKIIQSACVVPEVKSREICKVELKQK